MRDFKLVKLLPTGHPSKRDIKFPAEDYEDAIKKINDKMFEGNATLAVGGLLLVHEGTTWRLEEIE